MPWTPLAPATDFPEGSQHCLKHADHPLVVMNVNGTLHAVANVCPHAGLPLGEGERRGLTLTCPYHGYTYSIKDGRDLDDPEFGQPLKVYPIRIEGDMVQVDLPAADASPPSDERAS